MFHNFYYKNIDGHHVYMTIHLKGDAYEMSFYEDNALLNRTLFKSTNFRTTLEKGELEIKVKGLYPKVLFHAKHSTHSLKRVKRSRLASILTENGISNEINRPVERYKLKLSDILVPVALIALGLLLYHLVRDKANLWLVPSMLVLLVAYGILYTNLFKLFRFSILDQEIKLFFLVVLTFLSMAISQDLLDYIFYA